MRVIAEDVVAAGKQIVRFYKPYWEVVSKVPPDCPIPDPCGSSATFVGGVPVKHQPGDIQGSNQPTVSAENVDQDHGTCNPQDEEADDPLQD